MTEPATVPQETAPVAETPPPAADPVPENEPIIDPSASPISKREFFVAHILPGLAMTHNSPIAQAYKLADEAIAYGEGQSPQVTRPCR